jgi:uncharacterized integral membrane protein
MLRVLAGLLWLLVGVALVLFAIANRTLVPVSIDPFRSDAALGIQLPLFLVIFAAVVIGVVLGGIADHMRSRRQIRRLHAQSRRREEEMRRAATADGGAHLPVPR